MATGAREELEPQTLGEHLLLKYSASRHPVDLRGESDKMVRADFLEWFLLVKASLEPHDVRGVWLIGADVDGVLSLAGAQIAHRVALEDCTFSQPVDLVDGTFLSLSFARSTLTGLNAEGVVVRGTVDMVGVASTASVDLIRARIGGALLLRDCDFKTADAEPALQASQMDVTGIVSLVRVRVDGQIRMIGARIGGVLNVRAADLRNGGDVCFQGERMQVGEGVWFDAHKGAPGLTAKGRLVLDNARIGGSLNLRGAMLSAPAKSIDARLSDDLISVQGLGVTVGQSLLCDHGFRAEGSVAFISAKVQQRLSFHEAVIGTVPGGVARLYLGQSRSALLNVDFASPPDVVDLGDAETGVFTDNPASWSKITELDGFVYTRMRPQVPVAVQERLRWLDGLTGYLPQPYEQLIAAYTRDGHEQEARAVGYAKQDALARTLGRLQRIWPMVLRMTVGYGYRTWLAGVWLAGLLVCGALVFHFLGTPIPNTDRPPPFQPVIYTVDLLLPIVSFGQEDAWRVGGATRWIAWSYVALGWILTTSVVAGLTRLLKRA